MTEFMFGVSSNKPTRANARKMEAIAKRHGAYLVEYRDPNGEYQRWFCGPNLGHPLDQWMADAVFADIAAEIADVEDVDKDPDDEPDPYEEGAYESYGQDDT